MIHADEVNPYLHFLYFRKKYNMDKTPISGKTTNESMILPKRGERK